MIEEKIRRQRKLSAESRAITRKIERGERIEHKYEVALRHAYSLRKFLRQGHKLNAEEYDV